MALQSKNATNISTINVNKIHIILHTEYFKYNSYRAKTCFIKHTLPHLVECTVCLRIKGFPKYINMFCA